VRGSPVALDQVADHLEARRAGGVDVARAVGHRRVGVVDHERPALLQAGGQQLLLARPGAEHVEAHVLVRGGEAVAVERRLAAALDPAEDDGLHADQENP
jgi:hypothetical protein